MAGLIAVCAFFMGAIGNLLKIKILCKKRFFSLFALDCFFDIVAAIGVFVRRVQIRLAEEFLTIADVFLCGFSGPY